MFKITSFYFTLSYKPSTLEMLHLLYNMKDKHKRTASAADLQGHCNLRQNSVSSASSYRVICVRLRDNLHQVTA